MAAPSTELILSPLGRPSRRYLALLALAGVGALWFAQAWAHQLSSGLVVTGIGDWGTSGGVPWGLYVGSFIWWVGIAHGGIIISAAVRLFRLVDLKPVARMAELLTLAALSMAALYIILHLGRPDRLVTSILPNLPTTIRTSPLAWDVTIITTYFVLTATYLALTIRADLHTLRTRLPRIFRPFYQLLLVGYRPSEHIKVERMAWWLALCLIVLAPFFLHGGVIPWLFALLPGLPGWFGAVQGPQFLAAALTSAMGAVALLAYVLRKAYNWEEILHDRVFAALARWMGLFALLFLWLQLQQVITGSAMAPRPVAAATAAKLATPLYWVAIGILVAVLAYVALQMLIPSLFSVGRTVVVAILALLAVLVEKTLFVVEGLMHPVFDLYEGVPGTYTPSWVELSSIVGAFSLVLIFFLVAAKVIPIVELEKSPVETKEPAS
jgi:Ni/Fe-hydrogenase subunit HybB-like protein